MPDRMLTSVELERFKAAFKPEPIPLRSFNVIIGRNGSGKSTLLEALQWLDTTMRQDARQACFRYYGIHDLINLRSQADPPYFRLSLRWGSDGERGPSRDWVYTVRVVENSKDATPRIDEEEFSEVSPSSGKKQRVWIKNEEEGTRVVRTRRELPEPFSEPDRLALGRGYAVGVSGGKTPMTAVRAFFERAVFLRLSPNSLARVSPVTRSSYQPLLDEEGQTLPALLHELSSDQRQELVASIADILHGIRGIEVHRSKRERRDVEVYYSLRERMPYRGRHGRKDFPIPAWMLSEGTRRITAILGLLHHDPPPSLLCIEEIENGLDPQTVRQVLARLRSAADAGTQVVLTTHSPWILDHVDIESILNVRRVDGDTIYERFAERPEVLSFDPNVPAGTRYTELMNRS